MSEERDSVKPGKVTLWLKACLRYCMCVCVCVLECTRMHLCVNVNMYIRNSLPCVQ